MPQHKSAKKRVRSSEKKRARNKALKTGMKNVIKKVRQESTKEVAVKDLVSATALLDKMAAKGLIHKNKAANQKSKLQKHVNKLGTEKAEKAVKAVKTVKSQKTVKAAK
jgi:small subunit ribosomal protein S20